MKQWLAAALLVSVGAVSACARKPEPEAAKVNTELLDVRRPQDEWMRQEPVRLLRDYVRYDTTPGHGEEDGAEFLRRLFDCEEIETEMICPSPGRCNVLARLPGRRHDNALLLLNHIDVVDAYAPNWRDAQPFEGEIRFGFLYGRGVYDMKSVGLAQA